MSKNCIYLLFSICILIAVQMSEVNSLNCWRCATDTTKLGFCDDPFDETIINEEHKHRQWIHVECTLPLNNLTFESSRRPVCKKMKYSIADKIVISRSCSWEYTDEEPNECMQTKMPANVQITFCETCQHDGCNKASLLYIPGLFSLIFTVLFKIQFLTFVN